MDSNIRLIQPIEIKWGNNIINIITKLQVKITFDDLSTYCILSYVLLNDSLESISLGSAEISGNDYVNWDGNNDYPFTYVANQLNLTLI